jgi:uncharacterized protein (DUF2126 family)
MIMTKKVKKRYGTISKLFQAAKGFYQRRREEKNEEKDETLFEVDFYGNVNRERDGMLYVFYRTDYLEITFITNFTKKLQMPVRIEGYQPKTDYRVEKMMVTPDPGVSECASCKNMARNS